LDHGITPKTVLKSKSEIFQQTSVVDAAHVENPGQVYQFNEEAESLLVADPVVQYMDKTSLEKAIQKTEKDMQRAAKNLEFMDAARLRDELEVLKKKLKELK
jgi:excinuclease ABC subunit B